MRVSELIAALQELDPELPVMYHVYDDSWYGYELDVGRVSDQLSDGKDAAVIYPA
jgi:hypothetical protein